MDLISSTSTWQELTIRTRKKYDLRHGSLLIRKIDNLCMTVDYVKTGGRKRAC
jgi:hypothetical protein